MAWTLTRLPIVAAVLVACGGADEGATDPPPPPPPAPVASVSISPSADTFPVDASLQLTATVRDSAGLLLAGRTVTWSLLTPSLGTISTIGFLRTSDLGVALAKAEVEGKSDTAAFTLIPIVAVSRRLPSLMAGDTTQLVATFTNTAGVPLAAPPPAWTSASTAIATVDATGIVHGISAGSTAIKAASAGGTDSQVVVVIAPRIGVNREITFLHDSSTPTASHALELWASSAGGPNPVRLTPDDFSAEYYRWSPDGSKLAAVGGTKIGTAGFLDLYIMNPDGSNLHKIDSLGAYLPVRAPDGLRLAFYDAQSSDVGIINATGLNRHTLPTGGGDQIDTDPSWSPDGRRIAWRMALPLTPCAEIWTMDTDGSHQQRVPLPASFHPCKVDWSPDGKQLTIEADLGIWLVNGDGTDLRPLSPNCSLTGGCTSPTYSLPVWSPDGSQVVFAGDDGAGSVNVVPRNGIGVFTLPVQANGGSTLPDWSPDGQRLLFRSIDPDSIGVLPPYSIFATMTPDGQDVVYSGPGFSVGAARWRP